MHKLTFAVCFPEEMNIHDQEETCILCRRGAEKGDRYYKNLPTVLANSSNHGRARCHNIECK